MVKKVRYGVFNLDICECEVPIIERWSYHLIGNDIPKLLPGVSFYCKCKGLIDRPISIPEETEKRCREFWGHPEDW